MGGGNLVGGGGEGGEIGFTFRVGGEDDLERIDLARLGGVGRGIVGGGAAKIGISQF